MQVIYGVQFKDLDDVFYFAGRPQNLVNYVDENIMNVLSNTSPASYHIDFPQTVIGHDMSCIFVPVDVVEEFIMFDALAKPLEKSLKGLITLKRITHTEELIGKLEMDFEHFMGGYMEDTENKIINNSCVAIVINNSTKEVIKTCVTIPRKIISKLDEPIEYHCHSCNHVEYIKGNSLPFPTDMYYKIDDDNAIEYYCECCAKKRDDLSHVGDTIKNKVIFK